MSSATAKPKTKQEKQNHVNRCLAGEYPRLFRSLKDSKKFVRFICGWINRKTLVSEHLYTITQKMRLTQDDREICVGRSKRTTICTKSSFSVSIPPQSYSHHCPPPLCGVL